MRRGNNNKWFRKILCLCMIGGMLLVLPVVNADPGDDDDIIIEPHAVQFQPKPLEETAPFDFTGTVTDLFREIRALMAR
ncbi:hypothetical protein JW905_02795 [bacterium]|nr:hypothetical protein [candidate division CSSED10-310 bacterium]